MSNDSSSIKGRKSLTPPNAAKSLAVVIAVAVIFFGAQFFATVMLILLMMMFGNEREEVVSLFEDSVLAQLGLITVVAALSTYLIWRVLKWRKLAPRSFLMLERIPSPRQFMEVFGIYLLYFISMIVITAVLSSFSGVDVDQAQELGVARSDSTAAKALIFIMLAVIPPIYEELLFRGFLFNKLKRYLPLAASVVVTSVLFGLAHLEYDNLNWIAAIDTFVFSCFLIYVSQRHKSLYSAMQLHAIKNSIAFYVLFVH